MNLWIVDRRVDNSPDPNENDGQAYEFSLPPLSGNALPTVAISAPASGSTFDQGDPITVMGVAMDPEDGDLTANLMWTSDLDGTIGSGGSFVTSTLSVGTHTITASVTDSGGLEGVDAISVTVDSERPTVEVRVAASTDDAEETSTGNMLLASGDLEMIRAGSRQTVGMRFNSIAIPQGTTITDAYVQFTADETDSEATSLTIEGEATDNTPTFSASSGNISTRVRTASSVSWSPLPWTTVGQAGPDQRTPNLAAIVQEIVNRPGWSSGNSQVIIITGTGVRIAEAFDGAPNAAPLFHVDYVVNSTAAPTASFTWATTDLTVSFTDTSSDGDGTVVGWSWDFGDGASSTAQNPSHTYGAAGDYTVALTVTDNDGATAQFTETVTVVTVSAISPNTVAAGFAIAVTITGSGFDSGATVTFENGTGGPPPDVSNVVVVDTEVIAATVTTKSGGPKRDRFWDVRVSNPDGASSRLVGGLTITP